MWPHVISFYTNQTHYSLSCFTFILSIYISGASSVIFLVAGSIFCLFCLNILLLQAYMQHRMSLNIFISIQILMSLLIFLDIETLGKSQTVQIGIGGAAGGVAVGVNVSQPPQLPSLPLSQLIFADQRLAVVYPVIQKFKNLITSDPLNVTSTWIGADICMYKGFYCESPPDNISAVALASIDFNGFQLAAPTLEGFIDLLPDIALFHANSNNFFGIIPPSIVKLPYLYELDISNNKFSGPFPAVNLGMSSLSFLDIRFNYFWGSVPPELFTKDINALLLNNNNFMTRLPDNIGSTHIQYLTLANNKFFGPIPRSIVKALSGLSEILLLNNMLTGCLPYEVGLLKDAVVIDAGYNNLTGPLPMSLGCLEKLEVLNFDGNQLYGTVPDILCGLGKLSNLSLSENYFIQVGPVCMRLIKNGVLDVRKNCVPGLPFQRSVAECSAFFARQARCSYSDTYSQIPCAVAPDQLPPPSS